MFSYRLAAITVQGAASQIVNHRAIAIEFADFQVRQAGVPRSEWREGHQRSAMVRSKCGIDEFHKGMSSYRSGTCTVSGFSIYSGRATEQHNVVKDLAVRPVDAESFSRPPQCHSSPHRGSRSATRTERLTLTGAFERPLLQYRFVAARGPEDKINIPARLSTVKQK